MRFAEEFWLWVVPLLPLVWLALHLGDRRAAERMRTLLGVRADGHVEGANPRLAGWRRFLLLGGLFWLLLALAQPQWGASEVTVTQRGSDIVVALDISNSMLAEDVVPNRMERAKSELVSFLRRLEDSRVGLVFFAGAAFVQCPLTLDYGTAEIFLKMAGPDMLSEQGTNIGGALVAARELLAKGREGAPGGTFQAILLVTDGEDLEGAWEEEGRACRDEGIRVIPVGVGDEGGGLIPIEDMQGRPAGFMKDPEGNVVTTHLDLVALEALAGIGRGSTFRIGVDGMAGDRLFSELQRLGRRDLEERRVSAYQERYVWPLLLAAICFSLRLVVRPLRPRGAGRAPGLRRASLLPAVLLLAGMATVPAPATAGLLRDGAAEVAAGRRAYAEGDYEAALTAFEAAVVKIPADPVASLALGETLFRLERYEEAATEFERARGLDDAPWLQAEALYNQGTTALVAGDPKSAAELLQGSLESDPEQEDALVNLETALRQLQQQQQQEQQEDDSSQDQEQENEDKEQQDRDQQEQQDRQQDQQQQDQQQDQQQQQDQTEPEEQPGQQPDDQPSEDQQQQEQQGEEEQPQSEPEDGQQTDPEELTRDQALQVLNALDRDEEELKRSVQQRLMGGKPRSGKKW